LWIGSIEVVVTTAPVVVEVGGARVGAAGQRPGDYPHLRRIVVAVDDEAVASYPVARVVDLGCGEGIITRALAARGATAVDVDPTERLVEHARSIEDAAPCGATYVVDDGTTLATLSDSSAEWVTAGLSLNNVPDLEAGVRSIRRVLAPGGQLAFTIPHPCFEAPHASWVDTDAGTSRRIVGDYFAQGFWRSANPSGVRRAACRQPTPPYLVVRSRRQ
jgi:SAM-dependent methyltransferase